MELLLAVNGIIFGIILGGGGLWFMWRTSETISDLKSESLGYKRAYEKTSETARETTKKYYELLREQNSKTTENIELKRALAKTKKEYTTLKEVENLLRNQLEKYEK